MGGKPSKPWCDRVRRCRRYVQRLMMNSDDLVDEDVLEEDSQRSVNVIKFKESSSTLTDSSHQVSRASTRTTWHRSFFEFDSNHDEWWSSLVVRWSRCVVLSGGTVEDRGVNECNVYQEGVETEWRLTDWVIVSYGGMRRRMSLCVWWVRVE